MLGICPGCLAATVLFSRGEKQRQLEAPIENSYVVGQDEN